MGDNGVDRAADRDEEEQKEEDAVVMEAIRLCLLETTLEIGMKGKNDVNVIFANAHSFVKLSQGNVTVQKVVLNLDGYHYRDWALQVLAICFVFGYGDRDDGDFDLAESDVAVSLYWQAFADAFGRVRHPIEVHLDEEFWECIEDFTGFKSSPCHGFDVCENPSPLFLWPPRTRLWDIRYIIFKLINRRRRQRAN